MLYEWEKGGAIDGTTVSKRAECNGTPKVEKKDTLDFSTLMCSGFNHNLRVCVLSTM